MEQNNPDIKVDGDGLSLAANSITENPSDTDAENITASLLGLAPAQQPDEPQEVDEEHSGSEELSEEETPTDESTEDEITVEDEDEGDPEDGPTDPDDLDFVDYEEAKNFKYPIKIKGEVTYMGLHEIQNQLARVSSASEKSREAKEQMEALAADREAFELERQQAQAIDMTNSQERELIALDYQYRVLGEHMAQANGEDYKRLDIQRQQIANQFYETQREVNEAKDTFKSTLPDALKSIVPSNMSSSDVKQISEWMEKASKWDEYQGKAAKAKPKLQGRKSIGGKASSTTPKSTVTKAKQERDARAKAGIASREDVNSMFNDLVGKL